MKFGANALIWTASFDATHLPLLPRIKERGFDGVEIPVFHPASVRAAEIRRALQDNGLECTTCSVLPAGVTIFDDDAAARARAFDHMKACIETTAALGGQLTGGPYYSPVGYLPGRRRTPDEWRRAAEFLRSIGEVLRANGVRLAIEPLNRFETFFLNTTADAAALCDAAGDPSIGILFDTFHANIEERSLGKAVRAAGGRLIHVHTCENDRGTPGSGHVPWRDVFAALADVRYDGWLTIESFGYNIPDIAAAAAIWRDLAASPEEIAFQGIGFIRRMAGGMHKRAAVTTKQPGQNDGTPARP